MASEYRQKCEAAHFKLVHLSVKIALGFFSPLTLPFRDYFIIYIIYNLSSWTVTVSINKFIYFLICRNFSLLECGPSYVPSTCTLDKVWHLWLEIHLFLATLGIFTENTTLAK